MEKENKDQLKKVLRAQLRDDLKQELQQIEAQSKHKLTARSYSRLNSSAI